MKKNEAAVALAKQRMVRMTGEQRSDVARTAALARWDSTSDAARKAHGAMLTEARAKARAGRKAGKKGK